MREIKFNLNDEEEAKATLFQELHEKKHGKEKTAIGGRYTWEFSRTSIGTVIKISCFCGAKEDCSDYDSW